MKVLVRFFIVFIVLTSSVFSAVETVATPPTVGDGSAGSPYEIATLANLRWLSETTSEWTAGKYFVQTADIDAAETSIWNDLGSGAEGFSPIGNLSIRFYGNYDGQGYTISNLYINRTSASQQGLFGYVQGGTIQNFSITDANVTVSSSQFYGVGIAIGGGYNGVIQDINITGGTLTVNGAYPFAGALVGRYSTGTITNCHSSADVIYNGSGSGYPVGGLIGHIGASSGSYTVTNSSGTGNVTVSTLSRAGGFAGELSGVGTVSRCFSSGNVTNTNGGYVGGFVGNPYEVTIQDCYTVSNISVTSSSSVGGFFGSSPTASFNKPTFIRCYAAGTITGGSAGGFGGQSNFVVASTDSFWDVNTTANTVAVPLSKEGDLLGKTTVEMKTMSTYTNWDFKNETANGTNDIWDIDNVNGVINTGYPYLSWEMVAPANVAPTDINLSSNTLEENSAAVTTVGMLTATDADSGDTHTFTLGCATAGVNDSNFSIDGTTLKSSVTFDYETTPSQSICVKVSDMAGATYEKNLSISITNLSEYAPIITSTQSDVTIVPGDSFSYELNATDADGDTLTWSLTPGTELNASCFTLSSTIPYTIEGTASEECIGTHDVNLTVTDGENNATQNFTITVAADTDGDSIPDVNDIDDDNDGIPDLVEEVGNITRDTDGDGIVDSKDLDSDNDGILDIVEAGGTDADDNGMVDDTTDTDSDGLADTVDTNPATLDTPTTMNEATLVTTLPLTDTDTDGTRDFQDVDSDNDGISDLVEGGIDPLLDADNNGTIDIGGGIDATGIATGLVPSNTPDTDTDGIPDYRDLDSDNDGLTDVIESGGSDTDGNGLVDVAGTLVVVPALPDGNNNGTPDTLEANNPNLPMLLDNAPADGVIDDNTDTDGDGIPDVMDATDGFGSEVGLLATSNDVNITKYGGTPIDVLGNGDTFLVLSDINYTQPENGTVDIDDNGTPDDPTDDVLIYTPDADFNNATDTFTYTITDTSGNTSTATVLLNVVCGSSQTSDSGDALGVVSMLMMMLLTGTAGLYFIRREEERGEA